MFTLKAKVMLITQPKTTLTVCYSWWKGPEESADKNSPLPAYFVDNSHFKVGEIPVVLLGIRIQLFFLMRIRIQPYKTAL